MHLVFRISYRFLMAEDVPKVDPYGKTKYAIQNRISYFVLRKVSFVMTQRNTKYKTRFRISYYVRSRLL